MTVVPDISDDDFAAAVTAAQQVWALMAIGVIDGDDSQITELTAALLRVSPAQCVPLTKEQAIALSAAVSDVLEYGSEAGDPAWLDRSACERFMNWFKGWESAA